MFELKPFSNNTDLPMRSPKTVMDLPRLGALYPYPLSFMRCLLRRVMKEMWGIKSTIFNLDEEGFGEVVYEITTPNAIYSYVIFSKKLSDSKRSDRVIAEDWDMTVTLCEGQINQDRLEFLKQNVPLQEKGRVDSKCLVLSRANKSMRNFEYVIDCLSSGKQPNLDRIAKVGYIFRTTAVYGSGKFGMSDWDNLCNKYIDFAKPFSAEMFSCFMIRHFSLELANWVARGRSPKTAVELDDGIKRYIGIGNATGLGMAPYLIKHPMLIANWIEVREKSLARIIKYKFPDKDSLGSLECLIMKAAQHLDEISTDNLEQNQRNKRAANEVKKCLKWITAKNKTIVNWQELIDYAYYNYHVETQELINAILTEVYAKFILDLENELNIDESYRMQPMMKLNELKSLIEKNYKWALSYDFNNSLSTETFWYRSEEKQEPRLGKKSVDNGIEKEMMMCIARDVRSCFNEICDIEESNESITVAHFAFSRPHLRYIIRRIQTMGSTQYGEIIANLLDVDVLPIHLLRCKLSFFGVGKFDPRSKKWVRNTMFQGAPLVSDIGNEYNDTWCFPIRPKFSEKLN